MTPLEQAVVDIFRTNASIISAIRFRWHGWTIQHIDRIADLIENGRVHVVLDPSTSGINHYNTVSNRMRVFRDPTSSNGARDIPFEALVVHEAVHALLDLERFPGVDMDAEAMCYIAQAEYHRIGRLINQDSGGFHRTSSEVANWLGGQDTTSNPPPSVPEHFRATFFQDFSMSPLYRRLVDLPATARNGGHFVSTRVQRYNGIPLRVRR